MVVYIRARPTANQFPMHVGLSWRTLIAKYSNGTVSYLINHKQNDAKWNEYLNILVPSESIQSLQNMSRHAPLSSAPNSVEWSLSVTTVAIYILMAVVIICAFVLAVLLCVLFNMMDRSSQTVSNWMASLNRRNQQNQPTTKKDNCVYYSFAGSSPQDQAPNVCIHYPNSSSDRSFPSPLAPYTSGQPSNTHCNNHHVIENPRFENRNDYQSSQLIEDPQLIAYRDFSPSIMASMNDPSRITYSSSLEHSTRPSEYVNVPAINRPPTDSHCLKPTKKQSSIFI